MKSILLTFSLIALSVSAVAADPVADRKALMKERGGLVGQLAPIAKGEQPFDAAKVAEVFAALKANADRHDVDAFYPAGSFSGDTKASPKIAEDLAGYKQASEKFKTDVDAAIAASPQDLDAFRAEFGKVTANCGACHQAWRI